MFVLSFLWNGCVNIQIYMRSALVKKCCSDNASAAREERRTWECRTPITREREENLSSSFSSDISLILHFWSLVYKNTIIPSYLNKSAKAFSNSWGFFEHLVSSSSMKFFFRQAAWANLFLVATLNFSRVRSAMMTPGWLDVPIALYSGTGPNKARNSG